MERRWSRHLDLADRAVLQLAGGDSNVSGYLHEHLPTFLLSLDLQPQLKRHEPMIYSGQVPLFAAQ